MKIMKMQDRIDRWDWIKERWSMKQMTQVVNSLVKSRLISTKETDEERKKEWSLFKWNVFYLNKEKEYALNENSLIAHQCLTNLIILRLTDEEYRHKLGIGKLTASEKRLLRQIMLNYELLYDTFHIKKAGGLWQ